MASPGMILTFFIDWGLFSWSGYNQSLSYWAHTCRICSAHLSFWRRCLLWPCHMPGWTQGVCSAWPQVMEARVSPQSHGRVSWRPARLMFSLLIYFDSKGMAALLFSVRTFHVAQRVALRRFSLWDVSRYLVSWFVLHYQLVSRLCYLDFS